MSDNLKIHHRKSIRLKGFDYSQAGGYFVTVVSHHRECLFGKVEEGTMCVNELGKIAQEYWDDIPVHFENVNLDVFVVMPNHVHGILFIRENDAVHVGAQHAAPLLTTVSSPLRGMTSNIQSGSLGAIVRSFKSAVSRRAGRELKISHIWQRNYFEHIIIDQTDYERIAGYILDNPSNWDRDGENPQFPS